MKDRSWACAPFTSIRNRDTANHPYICHIAPYDSKFEMEWFDNGSDGAHTLYYRVKDSRDEYTPFPLKERYVTIEGLQNEVDYELYVARDDGSAKSRPRLVNMTPPIEGSTIINYVHPDDQFIDFAGWWVGYPTIIRMPSGKLLCAHEIFGEEYPLVFLLSSEDEGKTWHYVVEMVPFSAPRLFLNKGKLYITGYSNSNGGAAIAESCDEGKTWTEPVTLLYSMLDKSTTHKGEGLSFHTTPAITHNGRIYIAFEDGNWPRWNDEAFDARIMSAPVDSNLLDKESWDFTPGCIFDHSDFDAPTADFLTAIEGNPMVGPDGEIYNLLRMDAVYGPRKNGVRTELFDVALLYKFKNFDEPLEYLGPVSAKVGNRHGFYVLKDDVTNMYVMLHNEETPKTLGRRNVISLSVSKDMVHWEKKATLLDVRNAPGESTVSQPSFIFDGDDILYTSRTAWGKLYNQHNGNMATLHRLKNFRSLIK